MPSLAEIAKVVFKLLTVVFAIGGIFFETKIRDSHKLNKWGKILVAGTLLSFACSLIIENQDKLDKIQDAKTQIDSISNHTQRLLNTTEQKLNAQLKTLHTLSNTILEGSTRAKSLFIKWEFDGVTKQVADEKKGIFNPASEGFPGWEIGYYEGKAYLPEITPRSIDTISDRLISASHSFLLNLIQAVPQDDENEVSDEYRPDSFFAVIGFGDNFETVIPFSEGPYQQNFGTFGTAEPLVNPNGLNNPWLGHQQGNAYYSLDWDINSSDFPHLVHSIDSLRGLTYLLPNSVTIIMMYNIDILPVDERNLTDYEYFYDDWYINSNSVLNATTNTRTGVFTKSSIYIVPDGNPSSAAAYDLTDVFKANYAKQDDPPTNFCDYVTFVFTKRVLQKKHSH